MASTIQVILQEDLKNLGKSGELVRVRPGYARNYLIPRSLAVPATLRNVAQVEHEQKASAARAAKAQAEAKGHADKISGITVKISRKLGDEGRLFGSVTTKDIEAALKEQHGIEIERKKLTLGDPIRAAGTYDVTAKLLGDLVSKFKVEVVGEKK